MTSPCARPPHAGPADPATELRAAWIGGISAALSAAGFAVPAQEGSTT